MGRGFKNPFNETILVVDVALNAINGCDDIVFFMNDEGKLSWVNSVLMLGLKEIE